MDKAKLEDLRKRVEEATGGQSLKLLIAHTIVEELRIQHPDVEQIDNERGDLRLPGGCTPQSAGCVIDLHGLADAVTSEVLALLSALEVSHG